MNSFFTFFQKEIIETHRKKRLYILIGIFALFGMLSPILARYMSEIITAAMGTSAPVLGSAPVWTDSWKQYYSNLIQMGGLSVILLYMNCVSGEKQNKTAALTLSKNLSPAKFLTAKYLAAVLSALTSFVLASTLCYAYTYYLFHYAGGLRNILISAVSYYVFLLVLISSTMFASTLAGSGVTAALLSLGGYLILVFSSYLPVIGPMTPGSLLSSATGALTGKNIPELLPAVAISLLLSLMLICSSIQILKHQEL